MTGSLAPTDVASQLEHVRESEEKNAPPLRYIVKESSVDRGVVESCLPLADIPIIDLSLIAVPLSCKEKNDEIEKLKFAVATWGGFQLVGHGIAASMLDKMLKITKQYFDLPMEEKQKCARMGNEMEGYGADPIVSQEQVLDWSERLHLKVFPEDIKKLNMWPDTPRDFRTSMDEYVVKVKSVVELLLGGMSRALNLEEDHFVKKHEERLVMAARFNNYPICRSPDLVLGVKPHSDGYTVTVLLQDTEVEGLQVLRDGQWYRVPITPNALVINAGDQLQIMSNGLIKSMVHRVTTNKRKPRRSLALFYLPNPETEIEPSSELISEERPQLYRKIKNYGLINFEQFQKGKVALDSVRI